MNNNTHEWGLVINTDVGKVYNINMAKQLVRIVGLRRSIYEKEYRDMVIETFTTKEDATKAKENYPYEKLLTKAIGSYMGYQLEVSQFESDMLLKNEVWATLYLKKDGKVEKANLQKAATWLPSRLIINSRIPEELWFGIELWANQLLTAYRNRESVLIPFPSKEEIETNMKEYKEEYGE